jgi:integrase
MKGKRPHTIPLSAAALDVIRALEPLRGSSSPWLLPSLRDPARPLSTLAHSLRRLHAASQTEKWSAHDLRHTLRSELSAMGVPLEVKELILAHALPGLAGTYDHHSYLRERGDALGRWARLLDRIKAGQETEAAEVATFTPRHG